MDSSALAAKARQLCGEFGPPQPWRDLLLNLGQPPTHPPQLRERLQTNALVFRSNYALAALCWAALCALWRPRSAVWVAACWAGSYWALILKRGVLNLPLQNGKVVTIMGRRLIWVVGGISALLLHLTGSVALLMNVVLMPILAIALHAVLRAPTLSIEISALHFEFGLALRSVLRGTDGDADDEGDMEGGHEESPMPTRDPAMASRVEQIRNKYRPPNAKTR